MWYRFLSFIYFLFFLFFSTSLKCQDANTILLKSYEALSKQEQLSYTYNLDINYLSENYKFTLEGQTFISFDDKENLIGFTFQFYNDFTKIVYNGAECFELDLTEKIIDINRNPNKSQLSRFTFLNKSPVSLKYNIPMILANDSIEKTLVHTSDSVSFYKIYFKTGKRSIDKLGNFIYISGNRNISYTVLIDKESYLPIEVIEQNDVYKDDYVKTKFDYNLNDKDLLDENSWYYSNYFNFKQKEEEVAIKLLEKEPTPFWELPIFDNKEIINSSSLNGNYVLLEFWIKNCGYCISAVSELNELQNKYMKKNIKVIGINAGDKESDVNYFINANNPKFLNVWDKDKKVTKSFGVTGFPYIFLLDKQGQLLFQGNLNSEKFKELMSHL
ncbi:TlpA family protein disulfide reductase [Sphingobacterium hungaricum]|uniref:Thioredoxin domain-containing protein n=1 Tax=Sphingobacterium hungaricum TaxID=2082723 RepID=A0A928UVA1_9SPHI|nr:TlpA disulfide reductase family protein [Sphingobacterium hungaricum]MBE8713860.1 hypothetical protein [Sphingobacterium hungaricum]